MASINDIYPSKYLSFGDLKGRAHTLTVSEAEIGSVGQGAEEKAQILLTFSDHAKQLGLNKTNAKAIADIYGSETEDWIGEQIVLFPTKVQYQQRMVDAIRVDPDATKALVQAKLKAARAADKARFRPAPAPAPAPAPEPEADDAEPEADGDIPF